MYFGHGKKRPFIYLFTFIYFLFSLVLLFLSAFSKCFCLKFPKKFFATFMHLVVTFVQPKLGYPALAFVFKF